MTSTREAFHAHAMRSCEADEVVWTDDATPVARFAAEDEEDMVLDGAYFHFKAGAKVAAEFNARVRESFPHLSAQIDAELCASEAMSQNVSADVARDRWVAGRESA